MTEIQVSFIGGLAQGETEAIVNRWRMPELPDGLRRLLPATGKTPSLNELSGMFRKSVAGIENMRQRAQLEVSVAWWLYDFIRANVKRGRVFELSEVMETGFADCLGYCKLFTMLARWFGLDAGVVDVVIDNAGRYVPHTAVMVKPSLGKLCFLDLWYGSKDIRHRRLGLRVRHSGKWGVEDIALKELRMKEDVSFLPDSYVDGITFYIRGNRHLGRREFGSAIESYSEALQLYPANARVLFNRAVAYDSMGESEKATSDYAQALRDDASIVRVQAREYDEIEGLIALDEKGIDELSQQVYLLCGGITTGRKTPVYRIAERFRLSDREVVAILAALDSKLKLA